MNPEIEAILEGIEYWLSLFGLVLILLTVTALVFWGMLEVIFKIDDEDNS